jgi:hypothetical protein
MITNITIKAGNKLEKKEHFWKFRYIVTELLYENDKHKISWNNVISVQRSIGFLAPGVSRLDTKMGRSKLGVSVLNHKSAPSLVVG